MQIKHTFTSFAILSALSACQVGGSVGNLPSAMEHENPNMQSEHGTEHSASADMQAFELKFKALVNGEDFACGKTYSNVGTSQSTLEPIDMRMYISGVHLMTASGDHVPLHLTADQKWQTEQVALLDFEDKTGLCSSGTPDLNMSIKGMAPKGEYTGVHFEMGVPFAMNHQDVNQAPSPLNLSSLFWVWRAGYKFARMDFKTTGQEQGYFVHIGSTGCVEKEMSTQQHEGHSAMGESATVSHCENPNRSVVTLDMTPEQTIALDLGQLLSNTNIDQNQADSAKGCQSGTDDGDCTGIFEQLGLPFGEQKNTQQRFFSVMK